MRQVRYREIADALRAGIAGGELTPGGLLPSESELRATHEASRVTIRRALELLRDEGLVDSRQGVGWFVAAQPLRQTLAELGTIEAQLTASGVEPDRRVLEFAFVPSTGRIEAVLGAGEVLRVRRINLADGMPFARVTVWCPSDLADDLSRSDVERESFIGLLPVELAGATQTIGAAVASDEDAALLEIPPGSPVLRVERVTHAEDGRDVLLAEHVFPAHRTEFVAELPHGGASIAPSGVRLVG
ncbi:MAG: GntR family transcriptional regulator [Actinomycetota bacterium]